MKTEKKLHSNAARIAVVLAGLCVIVIAGTVAVRLRLQPDIPIAPTDLREHPIYSEYEFTRDGRAINIGIQPLYLPTGIVAEALKRDAILAEALRQLDVSAHFFSFLKGDDVNAFMQQGLLDVGFGGDMPTLTVASNYDVIVPIRVQMGPNTIITDRFMLTSDLKGKRIAFPYGSISHYSVLKILDSAGIAEGQARLIPMEAPDMAAALAHGDIDAFAVWEPLASLALAEYPQFSGLFKKITTGYMYMAPDLLTPRREIAEQLLAAIVRAIRWLQLSPDNLERACGWNIEATTRLTGRAGGLSAVRVAALAEQDILQIPRAIVVTPDDLLRDAPLFEEFLFLRQLGIISAESKWESVRARFDATLLNTIMSAPQHYMLNEFTYQ